MKERGIVQTETNETIASSRIPAIDLFRGFAIVLMVFFTLILFLSKNLPDLITHNVPNSLHLGDFVFPMFLFASGMSLVFFAKKRETKNTLTFALDVVERFGKLAIIWIFLSPFTSGELFGVDELAISAILFVPTVILLRLRFNDNVIFGIGLAIMLGYLLLHYVNALPDFTKHYLGGYPAVLFYWPVMLGGVISGRNLNKLREFLTVAILVALFFLLLAAPYKMSVSPSFMAISVALSLGCFMLIQNIRFEPLERMGRDPFRYWVGMFVFFIIPVYLVTSATSHVLDLGWISAIVVSVMVMVALHLISNLGDWFISKIRPKAG